MNNDEIPPTTVTVNTILDRFERDYLPYELSPRTQIDYRRHVGHLRRAFGPRIVSELKPKDFGPFLDVRKGKFQRVRQLAVLSSAFSEAVSTWFLIDRNVLRDVKRPKGKPRDRLVSEDEFARMKALCPLRVRLAMDLAAITGQRQGDILDFRWSDLQGMELHVRQSKTGKRLAIEVTPDLEAVLDRCYQLPERGEFILTRTMGGRFTSEGFRALWQRCMRKWCRLGNERFTFHDLRAMAATRCPTIEMAMQLLGHSNISMTRRVYRRGIERVRPVAMSAVMNGAPREQSTQHS